MKLYRQSTNRISLRLKETYSLIPVLTACLAILQAKESGTIHLNSLDYIQLKLMVSYFQTGNIIRTYMRPKKGNIPKQTEFKECHKNFLLWLAENQKSKYTIESYRNVVAQFLNHLTAVGCREIKKIHPHFINLFFMKLTENWAITSIRVASSAMRSFLTYLNVSSELMKALPKNCPKHTPIIPILNKTEDELLKKYLHDESVSYKSKSIIGLCYYLGIRSIDIITLQLCDIDWSKDLISFQQSKTGKNVVFPLVPIVGNSIACYITEERPKSKYLNVFLSDYAPIRPLTNHSAIYNMVSNAFNKLNIRTDQRQGAHFLRHNSATKQLLSGTPISVISTLLGHSEMDTTAIYLTTDYESLRLCCIEPIFRIGR